MVIIQRVERLPSLSAHAHEVRGPKQAQLMRHGGLGVLNRLGEVAHAPLALHQRLKQPHPGRVAEQSERGRDGVEVTVGRWRSHDT